MYSKNDYIEIAKILKKNNATHFINGSLIVQDFIELFRENPTFDEEKFLKAVRRRGVK